MPYARNSIDWLAKLRQLLQTLAFCLGVSAILYFFWPNQAYEVQVVYSLSIGLLIWALIDFGRHAFPSGRTPGWPAGWAGWALPIAGTVLGYMGGTLLADWWTGRSSWGASLHGHSQWRFSITVTALCSVVAIYFSYSRGKAAWLQARMAEAHTQATEAQLKLLGTQLEPHMLFNTLANLRVLIGTDPERAQRMLDHIIAYLRATLTASRSTQHPLAQEFTRLRDYLELMAVRMGPRLTYTLDLPTELESAPVPPLLLQPLVENAIRHGLEPQVEGGHITVRAQHELRGQTRWLRLEVIDTGVGMPALTPPAAPGTSFGLTQVRERLATLHKNAAALEMRAEKPHGTRASIVFPLNSIATP